MRLRGSRGLALAWLCASCAAPPAAQQRAGVAARGGAARGSAARGGVWRGARAPQPTDLASQQRGLTAAYGEWDDSKSAEDVRGIIDKRRGEEPELPAEEWRLLCAKLKEKYGQHPLEVATQAGQGVEG